MVTDLFGMDENSKKLTKNGYKDDDVKDAADSQELDVQECRCSLTVIGLAVCGHGDPR